MLTHRRRTGAGADERGTVLVLMPVAVLVLVVLAAISVDVAAQFLAKRELANAAAAAANDAVSGGLGVEAHYDGNAPVINPSAARQAADASIAAKRLDHLAPGITEFRVVGETVTVTVSGRVSTIFAQAVPGGAESWAVSSQAQATAQSR